MPIADPPPDVGREGHEQRGQGHAHGRGPGRASEDRRQVAQAPLTEEPQEGLRREGGEVQHPRDREPCRGEAHQQGLWTQGVPDHGAPEQIRAVGERLHVAARVHEALAPRARGRRPRRSRSPGGPAANPGGATPKAPGGHSRQERGDLDPHVPTPGAPGSSSNAAETTPLLSGFKPLGPAGLAGVRCSQR